MLRVLRVQQCSSHVMAGTQGFLSSFLSSFLMRLLALAWGDVEGGLVNSLILVSWVHPPGTTFWWTLLGTLHLAPLSSLPPVACGGFRKPSWSAEGFCLERFCSDSQCSRLRG